MENSNGNGTHPRMGWGRKIAPEVRRILEEGEFQEISDEHKQVLWEMYGLPSNLLEKTGELPDDDREALSEILRKLELLDPAPATTLAESSEGEDAEC